MASAADRMRAHRQRKKAEREVLRVEVDAVALAATLVAVGFLAPCDEDDRKALAHAAARVLQALDAVLVDPVTRNGGDSRSAPW